MWQRFTERARKVVYFAQEEAGLRGQCFVSTEHLLLGVLREPDNVACRLLEQISAGLPTRVRTETDKNAPRGEGKLGQEMQLTPRAKRVIDLAYDEARELKNSYIGTEHLLLGVAREKEGIGGRVLLSLGVELDVLRDKVKSIQDSDEQIHRRPGEPRVSRAPEAEVIAVEGKEGESLTDLAARASEILNAKRDEGLCLNAITLSTEGGVHRILMVMYPP